MRIVYLANVDWFFASHFLHLARQARSEGHCVVVATHVERADASLREAGLEVVALPVRRGGVLPRGLTDAARVVAMELARDPDAVLHGFGLFGIAVGAMARLRSSRGRQVYTITGRGYSAVAPTLQARALRAATMGLCSRLADGPQTRWIAENETDLAACGLARAVAERRTAIVGGAGIDPQRFRPTALPPRPPLRCALVARMIWSKGIDIAVEAVGRARQAGAAIELTLVGPTDPGNPLSLTEAALRAYAARPGIRWLGRSDDIAAVWRDHHLAVLPSRGGEGLPKSLIEAAACGRGIVTSDVPGCREFAAATGGWTVAAGDVDALARTLVAIAADGDLAARGAYAAEVAHAGYTEAHAWRVTKRFYDELAGTV